MGLPFDFEWGPGPSSSESEILANQKKIIRLLEEQKKNNEIKPVSSCHSEITIDGVRYEYSNVHEDILLPIIKREAHRHKRYSFYLVYYNNGITKFI